MEELADAFNSMTTRFQEIKGDLDCQVWERINQLIRSERLAGSVFWPPASPMRSTILSRPSRWRPIRSKTRLGTGRHGSSEVEVLRHTCR